MISIMSEIIEVQAGKGKVFRIHKDVLEQSPFFKNVLKSEWILNRNGKPIEFKDEDPDIFAAYVQWLYSHNIDNKHNTSKWARMYVLGEMLMDLDFQNAVLATMMHQCDTQKLFPGGHQVNIIYAGTTEMSPARRLLVDFFVWVGGETWVNGKDMDFVNKYPTEFVNDLIIALMDKRPPPPVNVRPWMRNPASYFLRHTEKGAKPPASQ